MSGWGWRCDPPGITVPPWQIAMHLTLLHTDKQLWRVMDRSNPSTSSIFNNERSFLWLHAINCHSTWLLTRLAVKRPVIAYERSIKKCVEVLGGLLFKHVRIPRHSISVRRCKCMDVCATSRGWTANEPCLHIRGSWWMGRANNFVCGILKTIATKTAETSADDKRNEQRTPRARNAQSAACPRLCYA